MFFVGNSAFQTLFGNLTLYDAVGIVLATGEIGFFLITTIPVAIALLKEGSGGKGE